MAAKTDALKWSIRDAILFFGICVISAGFYCMFIAEEGCTVDVFMFVIGALVAAFITFWKKVRVDGGGASGGNQSGISKEIKADTVSSVLCKLHFHY